MTVSVENILDDYTLQRDLDQEGIVCLTHQDDPDMTDCNVRYVAQSVEQPVDGITAALVEDFMELIGVMK